MFLLKRKEPSSVRKDDAVCGRCGGAVAIFINTNSHVEWYTTIPVVTTNCPLPNTSSKIPKSETV
jgi:hypothetical protein